ncbi:signal peptidase I [Bacillus rubiinfantis]|uniref:signal peptidase I n=1 Tax=Bacillus rubiinfantis TaxID=1499680 RepID=UPI0005AA63C6|nr:signal peptidase I [Bacillus rubiinfantis]
MAKVELISWGKSVIIALAIVFIVRTFFFSPYIVEGSSMEPTLYNQEKIFVNKTVDFSRGDIIIIKGSDKNYVKRLIGFPGDKIEMKEDQLFVNGKKFEEPYLSDNLKEARQIGSRLTENFGPINVPKHYYFVMGDNRLYSMDSRNGLGFIKEERIVGKSEFVFYPFAEVRIVK